MGSERFSRERRCLAAFATLLLSCGNPPSLSGDAGPPADATAPDGTAAGDGADAAMCVPPETLCDGTCRQLDNDPANCGSCGHDCLGASCTAGLCEPEELAGSV